MGEDEEGSGEGAMGPQPPPSLPLSAAERAAQIRRLGQLVDVLREERVVVQNR